ncbi:hypothetical protein BDW22DRAFT_1352063 [Trametopsis cervina]|nr:hypothetical protein BDW22DRAFT_1352063 [Trametopsis cervina]
MFGAGSLFFLFTLWFAPAVADNTVCADSGMDWYTSVVGETPCTTYQKLRQICNRDYRVGIQNVNTPPDTCDEQVADCCCNSVSFALSMLCLTCQQGFSHSSVGYDAGQGAYQDYLRGSRTSGFCSPNTNQSLPTAIQNAVCNQNIKIANDLYGLFWTDGAWFYEYTAQTLQKNFAATNGNDFTHCKSTTQSSQAPAPPAPASSNPQSQKPPTTASSAPALPSGTPPGSSGLTIALSSAVSGASTLSNTSIPDATALANTPPVQSAAPKDTSAGSAPANPTSLNGTPDPNASVGSNLASGSGGISGGAIGGIIAAVLGTSIIACAVFWFLRRRKASRRTVKRETLFLDGGDVPPEALATTPYLAARQTSAYDGMREVKSANGTHYTHAGAESIVHGSAAQMTSSDSLLPDALSPSWYYSPSESDVASPLNVPAGLERHVDAGRVPQELLSRHLSGRLPPAYGEQMD